MEESIITGKGQVVVPARLRRRYGLKPGTRVYFIERNSEIIFQPLTKETIRSVHGLLAVPASVTKELLKERAKDKEHEEAKIEKRRAR
jgi:AbrB family looped-hinge helix DNA binding protein